MSTSVAALVQNDKFWAIQIPVAAVYTIHEASRILGVAAPVFYSYINSGRVKAYIVDGVKHVRHADLVAYIQRRKLLRRSLNAKIKPEPVIPGRSASSSNRIDYNVPLDYVE